MNKIKIILPLLAFVIAIAGALSSFASEDASLASLVPTHYISGTSCIQCNSLDPNYNVTYTCALSGIIRCKCVVNNVLVDARDNVNPPACQILWQVPIE